MAFGILFFRFLLNGWVLFDKPFAFGLGILLIGSPREVLVELIRSLFFGNEVYGFPGCVSINKSPHDTVGFSSLCMRD